MKILICFLSMIISFSIYSLTEVEKTQIIIKAIKEENKELVEALLSPGPVIKPGSISWDQERSFAKKRNREISAIFDKFGGKWSPTGNSSANFSKLPYGLYWYKDPEDLGSKKSVLPTV